MSGLEWPTLKSPMEFSISPLDTVVGPTSPYTGAREVMHRWHQWHVIITWNYLRHTDGHFLMSHLNRGRGGIVLYQVPLFNYRQLRGTKSGAVTLSGAHPAGATSIAITGGSGQLLSGDWIHINDGADTPQAYQVVSSESAGVIGIIPGLRVAHTSGQGVAHLQSVSGGYIKDTMELASDPGMPSMVPSPSPGYFAPFTVEFVTALRINP